MGVGTFQFLGIIPNQFIDVSQADGYSHPRQQPMDQSFTQATIIFENWYPAS